MHQISFKILKTAKTLIHLGAACTAAKNYRNQHEKHKISIVSVKGPSSKVKVTLCNKLIFWFHNSLT